MITLVLAGDAVKERGSCPQLVQVRGLGHHRAAAHTGAQ